MGGSYPTSAADNPTYPPTGVASSTPTQYKTMDSIRAHSKNFFDETQKSVSIAEGIVETEEEALQTGSKLSRDRTLTITHTTPFKEEKVMFEIVLPGVEAAQVVCVACPRPPQLKVLLSELQVNASLSDTECRLEYEKRPGEVVRVSSQKQLEAYLVLPNRPKLFLARPPVTR